MIPGCSGEQGCGGSGAYVEHRFVPFVVHFGHYSIDPYLGQAFVDEGQFQIGSRIAYGAAHLLPLDHRARYGVGIAQIMVGHIYFTNGNQLADKGGTDGVVVFHVRVGLHVTFMPVAGHTCNSRQNPPRGSGRSGGRSQSPDVSHSACRAASS